MKRENFNKLVYLSQRQMKYIKLESKKIGVSETEIIRRSLDKTIDQYEKDNHIKL